MNSQATMTAAVWHGRKDIRLEQVPLPGAPQPGWVQIRVHWCGICGSDLHEYLAGPVFIPVDAPHPLTGIKGQCILGHEFCGEIVATGEGVEGYAPGDKVAADACQHCGQCRFCKTGQYNLCEQLAFTGLMNNGAFAELVNVPAELLYRLPEGFPLEAGALIEPLAVGMHAVKKAGSLLGETVVVVGAGTVLTVEQMRQAIDVGADFLVTPGTPAHMADALARAPLPVVPGAASPTELLALLARGFRVCKLFPATAVGGLAMIKGVAGPMPELKLCPTGGITEATAADYLGQKNVVCIGGSWMVQDAWIRSGQWDAVRKSAAAAAAIVRAVRAG